MVLAVEQRARPAAVDEYGPGEVGRQPLEPTTDSVPGALLLVLNSDGDGNGPVPRRTAFTASVTRSRS